MTASTALDCVVIGAGPSGLTAAMYLRRFHRDIAVIDAGESRARWIPRSHNCPGFPGGVPGTEFLKLLKAQAQDYGVTIQAGRVEALRRQDDLFRMEHDGEPLIARSVILATGIRDVLPSVPWAKDAVDAGALRLCPICDGYEASDGRLACYGVFETAIEHALFLRTFSDQVYVATAEPVRTTNEDIARAVNAGIRILDGPCRLQFDGTDCWVLDAHGKEHRFDSLYPVLGSRSRSGLATQLGAKQDPNGDLIVDAHQMTSVKGLYAVGDVVSALNQISVGLGHAAVAATAIHNRLPENPRAAAE